MENNPKIEINKEWIPENNANIDSKISILGKKFDLDEMYRTGYTTEKNTNEKTGEITIDYKVTIMWETLDIMLDGPELIKMLKLLDTILSIYKKEWFSFKKWEKFYTKLWKPGIDKLDIYIDNRPLEFFDTNFLTQESIKNILNEDDDKYVNRRMQEITDFLNKIIEKM